MKRFAATSVLQLWLRTIGLVFLSLYGAAACTETGDYSARQVRIFDGDSFVAMRSALRALIQDTDFTVRTVTIDTYGRTVAVITLPDGRQVNSEMVRAGNAWVYRRYTNDAAMMALEDQAKENKLGLWRLPPAERIPPWEWRKRQRN
jgi:endonuclease YncB( thermonuclease family)